MQVVGDHGFFVFLVIQSFHLAGVRAELGLLHCTIAGRLLSVSEQNAHEKAREFPERI